MKASNLKYIIYMIFAVSSLLMGCEDYSWVKERYKPSLEYLRLSVSDNSFDFDSKGATDFIGIYSDGGVPWSFTSVPSWLSLIEVEKPQELSYTSYDKYYAIRAEANAEIESREAVFCVSVKKSDLEMKKTITASQSAASSYISFPDYSYSSVEVDGANQSLAIKVDSNIPDLKVELNESWAEVSYNAAAKVITVELQANETDYSRTGTIYVTSEKHDRSARLTIRQLASDITLGGTIDIVSDGGTVKRKIKSDLPWTAKTSYSWIEFSPKSGGAGETEVTINVAPSYSGNKRSGDIYFYFGTTSKDYIRIYQDGRYLNVSPTSITLSADENASDKISIDSDTSWEIATCPEWVSVSKTSGGAGKSTITITAQKNNSLNSRRGTIKIKDSKSGGLGSSVTVTQNGIEFGNQKAIEFSWKASQQPLTVPLPGAWEAAVSDGWISLSEYIGEGEKQLTVSVTRNDNEDLRNGTILFTSEGKSYTIKVVQGGQYLKIASTSGEVIAMGGAISLSYSASFEVKEDIEYQTDAKDWIKVEKEDGTDNKTYKIKVDYNPSINERTAQFKISPIDSDTSEKYTQGVIYSIKQFGRSISADKSAINMFAKGGTSEAVIVTSDGKYSIEKDSKDNWYTLVPNYNNNSFYIVVTENNSSEDRYGNVNLVLKDLPQGEEKILQIEVHQYRSGVNISFDSFEDDTNW